MIHDERIRMLNRKEIRRGRLVLYWMQASQRAECNHALEYAARQANALGQPLVGAFGLTDEYPEANERHYAFMLRGLAETSRALRRRGVQLVVRRGAPAEVAAALAEQASLLVADCGYLRHQRAWRRRVARAAPCRAVQVESDVVVPVQVASEKEEYAARTLRPKLHRLWPKYLVELKPTPLRRDSLDLGLGGIDAGDVDALLAELKIDREAGTLALRLDGGRPGGRRALRGGAREAGRLLRQFIRHKLDRYADDRSDPSLGIESDMSAYLHFGQISPLAIALAVRRAPGVGRRSKDAYLEELLVRRELSANFVYYNPRYDSYAALPAWARATLRAHRRDRRPRIYTAEEMENARTQDEYWNAAMTEMRRTGKMHNYMRMYWGKKIIEWTRSPRFAFRTMLALNNRYFLDGRDGVSYANVAWCFGKHDRPWGERDVFGTVRYMSAAGLERKFDIDAYVQQVHALGE